MSSTELVNINELRIFMNLIDFQMKFNINPEEIAIKLNKAKEVIENNKFTKEEIGGIYNLLGILYSSNKEFDISEEKFMISLQIREEILPPDHTDMADLFANLGNLYINKLDFHKSKKFYTKS